MGLFACPRCEIAFQSTDQPTNATVSCPRCRLPVKGPLALIPAAADAGKESAHAPQAAPGRVTLPSEPDPLSSSWPPQKAIPVNRLPNPPASPAPRAKRASSPSGRATGMAGRVVMLLAAGAAVVSLFLVWVDNGVTTVRGFESWGLVLFALYAYPLVQLFRNRPLRKLVGLTLGLAAVTLTAVYISGQRVETAEHVLHVA